LRQRRRRHPRDGERRAARIRFCHLSPPFPRAQAPAARAPEKARGAGGASQPWRAAQSWSSGSWGSDWPKGQKRERSWGSDWKKKDTRKVRTPPRPAQR
jgi:hypothetical protein